MYRAFSLAALILSFGLAHAETPDFSLPMKFDDACLGNAWESCYITAVGKITADTPRAFRAYVKDKHMDGDKVLFHSPGGSLIGGLELARAIRELGLGTYVGTIEEGTPREFKNNGVCASACAYAFMGGVRRDVEEGNRLGLHQFYSSSPVAEQDAVKDIRSSVDSAISTAQVITGLIAGYLVEMGVDARLLQLANASGPQGMTFLDEAAMTEFGVLTKSGFSEWSIEPYGNGLVASAKKAHPSTPYDTVDQVTALCSSRDKQRYLLLTSKQYSLMHLADPGGGSRVGATIYSTSNGFEKEYPIPGDQIRISPSGSGTNVRIRLTDELARLTPLEGRFLVRLETPRADGQHFANLPLASMDRKMITLAFRNCI
jgi:hypothetical protein